MLVTKEIIAKMKHIVTTATMLIFFFSICLSVLVVGYREAMFFSLSNCLPSGV